MTGEELYTKWKAYYLSIAGADTETYKELDDAMRAVWDALAADVSK
jgi:hypothetical protein